MLGDKTSAVADLIRALASLLWPASVIVFVCVFHAEIRGLLRRFSQIKKGKLFGQEFELDLKLEELQAAAVRVEEEVAAAPAANILVADKIDTNVQDEVLRGASHSPKATLMLIGAELEKRVRQLLAATGWQDSFGSVPISKAMEKLRQQGSLPEHVSGSVKLFLNIRSKIIHGGTATDEDVLRAIDSGTTLLRAIDAIPAAMHAVHRVDVPIYSDAATTKIIPDARGLILESTSPGGTNKSLSIFPTTRTHFEVGKRVAWEWNMDKVWGPAWYKDPDTDEIKSAWHQAAEFVGRHLDDIS